MHLRLALALALAGCGAPGGGSASGTATSSTTGNNTSSGSGSTGCGPVNCDPNCDPSCALEVLCVDGGWQCSCDCPPTTSSSPPSVSTTGDASSSSGASSTASDASTSSSSGASSTSDASTSSTSGASSTSDTGGELCPLAGTCVVFDGGPCEAPTGPVGNGCCACGPDDHCSEPCKCAAPDTPIATPAGERPIADLRPGDLVYSLDGARVVAVPVLRVSRVPAPSDHAVVRLTLRGGRVVEMSPAHPTAEGLRFDELAPGDLLGDAPIVAVERVPYPHAYTHDILPASPGGAYFAAGALVGSTLAPARPTRTCE